MRVSVNVEDPGFVKDAFLYKVYLNGEELEDCITADEEERFAVVFDRNDKGGMRIDTETGYIADKRVYGEIKIVKGQNNE